MRTERTWVPGPLKPTYAIPDLPPPDLVETVPVLREAARAHRFLAELKGRAGTIPNQGILIDTLSLQEAKASSEIENIVTTQDELFQTSLYPERPASPAAKESHPSAPEAAVPAKAADAATPAAPSEAGQVARQWLELVDAGKWQESWAATARSFRAQNTVAAWQSASEGGRVPLGRVLSRRGAGEEDVPAPPRGLHIVRFRTDFANKACAAETLSLVREDGRWRVVGYYIE